ncbi:hypothetical protein LDO26_03330 [Luteimonas sp. BDR2-5]|uniref:hypothetical protein n=1 Tax=Proluteimonas luteida TaxID=2878685 RepID=UPI001E3A8FCB|nr:hypothetical protein [Luteimonas sp. BDR2-5]MCD9027247.1 hypothetical protein [Luteimonas sp. BDR2-5]
MPATRRSILHALSSPARAAIACLLATSLLPAAAQELTRPTAGDRFDPGQRRPMPCLTPFRSIGRLDNLYPDRAEASAEAIIGAAGQRIGRIDRVVIEARHAAPFRASFAVPLDGAEPLLENRDANRTPIHLVPRGREARYDVRQGDRPLYASTPNLMRVVLARDGAWPAENVGSYVIEGCHVEAFPQHIPRLDLDLPRLPPARTGPRAPVEQLEHRATPRSR